jgi:signal transduction histidine kinase
MDAAPARTQAKSRPLSRLYLQGLLFVVLPLCAAVAVLLLQINRLVGEERERQVALLAEANRQAQFALDERVERMRQVGTLLAGSREVIQALVDRDNGLLHIWGRRVIAAGLATEVTFIGADGLVVARGHREFSFGDVYLDPLISAADSDRGVFAGISTIHGGRPALAARLPVLRFDVQWVGTVLLYRELAPEVLDDLGVPPDVRIELRSGRAPERSAPSGDGLLSQDFDLPARSAQGFHLHLTKEAGGDIARLRALTATLWVLGALGLLVLPGLTLFALYRLLTPVRRLHERLQHFAVNGTNSETLLRDIEALADTRNELGAIAASVAGALRALRAAQADLVQSQKLAGLGAMVAGVSHELNTPLGNSITAATTLRERASEVAREIAAGSVRRSTLERFLADCEEATRILEASLARAGELLQSFKQVAIDQASDRRRDYDLREVAADVLLTLRPTLKKLPITVALDIPAGLRMEGFPGALAQVLTNLVQNAAVHGLEGAGHGSIRISAEAQGERVTLRVADDGRGIPAETLGSIFEQFFTTRLGRGGSGLGLYISRKLVTGTLGGGIDVRSTPGSGTEFVLDLPRRAPG